MSYNGFADVFWAQWTDKGTDGTTVRIVSSSALDVRRPLVTAAYDRAGIRLPLPRGLRPPNDEPNMEFIANREIIFGNDPEPWDLDDNNNPIPINNAEDADNRPRDAALGAEVRAEVNRRTEAVERSRERSTNDDGQRGSGEHRRRSAASDNTSDSDADLDGADGRPRPGPSWQRSEDDDDEDESRRNRAFPRWHDLRPKSSDSSPDFDFYQVNPLLCGSDWRDESGDTESKPSGEFSARCAADLSQRVTDRDPAPEASDSEERSKDFSQGETERQPALAPFRVSSEGPAGRRTERGSGKSCRRWDRNVSEKSADRDRPDRRSPDHSDSEETLEPDRDRALSCGAAGKGGLSSDEDPQPGPPWRVSRKEAGRHYEMTNATSSGWRHDDSDSGADLEDAEEASPPAASRKRCGQDRKGQSQTGSGKRSLL